MLLKRYMKPAAIQRGKIRDLGEEVGDLWVMYVRTTADMGGRTKPTKSYPGYYAQWTEITSTLYTHTEHVL